MPFTRRLQGTALVSTLVVGVIAACSTGPDTRSTNALPTAPPPVDDPVLPSKPESFVDHARVLTTQTARTWDATRGAEKLAALQAMQARFNLQPEVTPQPNWTLTTSAAVVGSVGVFGASFTTPSSADQMFFGTSTSATGTLTGGYNTTAGCPSCGTSNFFALNNLHAATPTVQWSVPVSGGTSASVALSGNGSSVYVLSDTGTLYCFQAATGATCSTWTNAIFTLNGTAITPWVDTAANAIYVHNGSGALTRLNATTGHPQWTYVFTGSASHGWPLEANNLVYIGDGAGKFYRIQDPTTGTADSANTVAPSNSQAATVSGANGNCNGTSSIDGSASLDSSANLVFLPYEGCAVSFPHYCNASAGCTTNSGTWNWIRGGWTGSVPNNTYQTWPTLDGTYLYWVVADKPTNATPISALWKAPYSLTSVSGSNLANASSSTGASVGSAPVVYNGLAYVGDESGYVEEFGCASAKSATTSFVAETSASGTKVGTPIEFDDATGNIEYGFTSSTGGGVAQFPLWETGTAANFTWNCPTNMVACDNQQCGTGNNKTQCVPQAQCNSSACTTVAAAGMTVQYGVAAAEGSALVGAVDAGTAICPSGSVIQAVLGADYGLPPTSDATSSGTTFAYSGTCDATDSLANTENACASALNSSASCSLTANNATFGDPCVGTGKHYYAWFACGPKTDAGAPTLCSRQNVVPASGSDPCSSGTCGGTCSSGWADCNTNRQYDGCETNIATDTSNCGSCGHTCTAVTNATASCSGGTCGSACNSGYSACTGACVNEQTDNSHCGSCTKVCGTGLSCVAASCVNSQSFTTVGTSTFTIPSGVTSFSAVVVGAGGGAPKNGDYGSGGGGGQLCYANNIPATPGDTVTITVGAGGSSSAQSANDGGGSTLVYGSITLAANGGGGGNGGGNQSTTAQVAGGLGGTGTASSGITATCFSGGNGGPVNFTKNLAQVYGGGGGAGGYTGAGGNGGAATSNVACATLGSAGNGTAGMGGAGGGGGGGSGTNANAPVMQGGSGGGVGIYGSSMSITGAGGALYCTANNTNGSGGGGGGGSTDGQGGGIAGTPALAGGQGLTTGAGGAYGGGGGGGGASAGPGTGGQGAVRIIWGGTTRTYPANASP